MKPPVKFESIYKQNFESGVQQPGWQTWDAQPAPGSWDYSATPLDGVFSATFAENQPGVSLGAFYNFVNPLNEMAITFLFRTSAYPQELILEVCDLYNKDGEEVLDLFLDPAGKILLTIGRGEARILTPLPIDTTVAFRIYYKNNLSIPSIASVAWTLPGQPLPTSGPQFASAPDGIYHTPITKLLWGPLGGSVVFYYDDLDISIPVQHGNGKGIITAQ